MLRATSTPATPSACSNFHSTYASACRLQFDVSKQREVETLLHSCEWKVEELKFGPACFICGPSRDGTRVEHGPTPQTMRPIAAARVRLERCEPPPARNGSQSGGSWHWEMFRIGPLNTTGGNDWTHVHVSALASRYPRGSQVAISDYFLGSTSTDGKLLPYPPLHQHHFHIETVDASIFAGALISHGDDQCKAADGGVACLVRRMPSDHVHWLKTPFSVDADINDVRARGSKPMTHWAVMAIKGMSMRSYIEMHADDLDKRLRPQSNAPRLKALTQMRLTVYPLNVKVSFACTYGASRPLGIENRAHHSLARA